MRIEDFSSSMRFSSAIEELRAMTVPTAAWSFFKAFFADGLGRLLGGADSASILARWLVLFVYNLPGTSLSDLLFCQLILVPSNDGDFQVRITEFFFVPFVN